MPGQKTRCARQSLIATTVAAAMAVTGCSGGGSGSQSDDSKTIVAQKGFITGAQVVTEGGEVIGRTSAKAGALGELSSAAVESLDPMQVVTIQGVEGSVDTLDGSLDDDDPSFNGKSLKAVYDGSQVFRVNPLTHVVARRFEQLVEQGQARGTALKTARSEIGGAFKLASEAIGADMMSQDHTMTRLHSERIYALAEIAQAAGSSREALYASLIDQISSDEPVDFGAALEALADSANEGEVSSSGLARVPNTMASIVERSMGSVNVGEGVSPKRLVSAQKALAEELAALKQSGKTLNRDNVTDVARAVEQAALRGMPVAEAGDDIPNAKPGVAFSVDGTQSSAPNGRELEYQWASPDEVSFSSPNQATTEATIDEEGTYTLTLAVDNGQRIASDSISVTVKPNTEPVANAGNQIVARAGEKVFASAGNSYDEDGDQLSHSWAITAKPDDSSPTLSDANALAATFKADTEGRYTLELTVSDGLAGDSDTTTVLVDQDGDGLIGSDDPDPDGDGRIGGDDAFPNDPAEFADTDDDGRGNYAQVDHDSDGVADTADKLPFDADAQNYPGTVESEFNNNINVANAVGGSAPFNVSGVVASDADTDYYSFSADAGAVLTVGCVKNGEAFEPSISVAAPSGNGLNTFEPPIKGTPYAEGVMASIDTTGTHYLVVTDYNGQGKPGFEYSCDVFVDRDMDALDDNRELAVGIDPASKDMDDDGIPDGAEFNVSTGDGINTDVDGDGLPNWLDSDADGDRIPDRLEGAGDADGDGLANFVDTDADGNGISDLQEAGADPTSPRDTDRDGTPDYLDTDDDGDGLLDINDDNRLTQVESTDLLDEQNRVFVTDVNTQLGSNGREIGSFAREGQTITIEGEGFSATPQNNTVIFEFDGKTFNTKPTTASSTELVSTVPATGDANVSVVTRQTRSNTTEIEVARDFEPVLYPLEEPALVTQGDRITLKGENFGPATTVNFSGKQADPASITDNELDVYVPDDAEPGFISVHGAFGDSNRIQASVRREVYADVQLPTGSAVDYDQLKVGFGFGQGGTPTPSSWGSVDVSVPNAKPASINVTYDNGDASALLMSAYVLPGDSSVDITPLSTAIDLIMPYIELQRRVAPESHAQAMSRLESVNAVQALAQAIEKSVANAPMSVFDTDDQERVKQVREAIEAGNESIEQAIDSGDLTPRDTTSGSVSSSALPNPTVSPEEQYSVAVRPVRKSSELTGNVLVENDTSLYLSAKVTPKTGGPPLRSHISEPIDPGIITPQGGAFNLWIASEKNLQEPDFNDANVEVITPTQGTSEVSAQLLINTVFDKIIFQALGSFMPSSIEPHDLLVAALESSPGFVREFKNRQGDPFAAANAAVSFISEDVLEVGPFTQALVSMTAENISARYFAKQAGKALTGLKAIDIGLGVASMAPAIADLDNVRGKLDYEVEWPVGISEVDPGSTQSTNSAFSINVKGRGFRETYSNPVSSKLIDQGNGAPTTRVTTSWTSRDGRQMKLEAPASFARQMKGPIEVVVVKNGNEFSSEPHLIKVTDELTISDLEPAKGTPGRTIVINGSNFSGESINNQVTFAGTNKSRASAKVLSSDHDKLVVEVPPGAESGGVTVETGGEVSNSKTFDVLSTDVSVIFGDNGSATDDTFSLSVDGKLIHTMKSPAVQVGPFELSVGPGRHTATLNGITAPDDVGTYRIDFSGVSDVSGSATSGDDLTAGRTKRFEFTVEDPSVSGSRVETSGSHSIETDDWILWKE